MEGIEFVPVTDSSGTAEARRVALRMADRIGFSEVARGNLGIVVTEASTNLLKHAGGGQIILRYPNLNSLEVMALDSGPGMRNIAECLRDGYSTAGSPGTGLGAIRRLSTEFDVHAIEGSGTVLIATCPAAVNNASANERGGLWDYTALVSPIPGEVVCGDTAHFVTKDDGIVQVMVADGLGHGPLAAECAIAAKAAFEANTGSPMILIRHLHEALRGLRGAAVAIAELDRNNGKVRYCGVGNISGAILQDNAQHMVSMNGIVGHQNIRPREFEYKWAADAVLVMSSDGLSTRWQWQNYASLRNRKASLIAGTLFRDLRKQTDDATVAVLRERVAS
jgi:anti-sigma regulatory factor (Ser/Thr protein kinase)